MHIWVDADACPKVIKEILFRAAERKQINLTLVANHPLRTPPSRYIKSLQVPGGFDVADNKIVQSLQPGDLVITADIPLAAEVIEKEGHALNPRGTFYTKENIQERLAKRNFMEECANRWSPHTQPKRPSGICQSTGSLSSDILISRYAKMAP